jgi:type II secretory ATPase GspE/PulE/Tfp pilus assembly ATPase PilB-like protein
VVIVIHSIHPQGWNTLVHPENLIQQMPSNHKRPLSIESDDYQTIVDYFRDSKDVDSSIIERLNVEQMFVLIDGILPIEACLYYQVLPLFLDGSRLNLGMVSPGDTAATDYVRRIVSYLNYSLVTRRISSEALRASLTAYLRHSDKTRSGQQPSSEPSAASRRAKRLADREQASQVSDASTQQTLVVDSPVDLNTSEIAFQDTSFEDSDWEVSDVETITIGLFDEGAPDYPIASSVASIAAELPDIPVLDDEAIEDDEPYHRDVTPPDAGQADSHSDDSLDDEVPAEGTNAKGSPVEEAEGVPSPQVTPDDSSSPKPSIRHQRRRQSPRDSTAPSGLLRSPIQLELEPIDTSLDTSEMAQLPSAKLLPALLVRTLDRGIGRLYFERHETSGRILWSEDGVLQSVLEGLPIEKFIQVMESLKALTKLPIHLSDKPIQVELERLYQYERILLRFRFVPTPLGEEATLQVLRGAALRFYQRQQLSKLSRDAITTAQTLQNKVNALRDRLLAASDMADDQTSNILPTLSAMIDQIEGQLDDLEDMMK